MKSTYSQRVTLLFVSATLLLSSFANCKEDKKDNTALIALALLAAASGENAGAAICDGASIQGGNTALTGNITSSQKIGRAHV